MAKVADDLGQALEGQENEADRNQGPGRSSREKPVGGGELLGIKVSIGREFDTSPAEEKHRGKDDNQVDEKIVDMLASLRKDAVDDVDPNMSVAQVGEGPADQELGGKEHPGDVVSPGCRRVEKVAHSDLIYNHQHQGDDYPGRESPGPLANFVDQLDESHLVPLRSADRPRIVERPGLCK